MCGRRSAPNRLIRSLIRAALRLTLATSSTRLGVFRVSSFIVCVFEILPSATLHFNNLPTIVVSLARCQNGFEAVHSVRGASLTPFDYQNLLSRKICFRVAEGDHLALYSSGDGFARNRLVFARRDFSSSVRFFALRDMRVGIRLTGR